MACAGLDLEPDDFAWLTNAILVRQALSFARPVVSSSSPPAQGVANVCCEGRVVSVLEGGYGTQVHERKHNTWSFNRCRSFPTSCPSLARALMRC